MTEVPRLKLSAFFRLFQPTHVIGTSYTLSLAFFEGMVFPKIGRTELRRCLLLADQTGFQRSLVEAGALRDIGREYMAACVPHGHSFHPKVWVMVGANQAAVLAGSGNLTQSGFVDNAELFDAVHLRAEGPNRAVADDVADFLTGLASLWPAAGRADQLVLDALGETRAALARVAAAMPPDPDPSIRFFSNFRGPLVDQLAGPLGGGTLYAAAPYFGGSAEGLRLLRDRLSPKKIYVFPAVHSDGTIDAPLRGLKDVASKPPRRLALGEGRFAHLKLYGADTDRGQWLFTTSANCTLAALGGQNVEAGILRRTSRAALRAYFKPSTEDLPSGQRSDAFAAPGRWLPLAAVDGGDHIELVASGRADLLPLRDVEITLQAGSQARTVRRGACFSHGRTERLPLELFGDPPADDEVPLLRLSGRSSAGDPVAGAAFLDRPLLLGSEPTHRSAWRAALAVLGREGIPQAGDIACLYHLVQGLFEPADQSPGEDGPPGSRSGSRPQEDEADRVAVWPPATRAALPTGLRGSGSHPVFWFQNILSALLAVPRQEAPPDPGAAEPDDEGPGVEPTRESPVPRAAASVWDLAVGGFDDLIERLARAELTPEVAPKVWPLAIAVLLVTLATRRLLAEQYFGRVAVPSTGEVIDRFLRAAFGDRSLPARHKRVDTEGRPTDPSVAAELGEKYGVVPPADLAAVLAVLFAHQHARYSGNHRRYLHGWLVFRDLVPGGAEPEFAEVEAIYRRYLADPTDGVSWEGLRASLAAVRELGWSDCEGYQELCSLRGLHSDPPAAAPPDLASHLAAWYDLACRRARLGRPKLVTTHRFRPACPADKCPYRYREESQKWLLADHRPVICSGCGAILVSERLFAEYEAAHGPTL